MRATHWLALPLLVLSLVGPGVVAGQETSPTAVVDTFARAAHLRRGVNLSDWFRQTTEGGRFVKEKVDAAVTPADLTLIRAMGFDHVRLCVNPAPIFTPREADGLRADAMELVDSAVRQILDAGLSVEIDLQPDEAFKRQLSADAFVEQFADFWRAFASHYAWTDPDRVFFEIINEPELHDPYRWYGIESRVAAAIREGAPRHTLIAAGAHFSDEDDLLFLQPLRDPNVIYAFHFYQPFLFTHQGATWAEYYWHFLKGVPYPASRDAARAAAARVPDPLHRLAVERYGESHWNGDRVGFEVGQVAAWAARYHVPVICNEFGVYTAYADAADRARWLADVRAALEQHHVGWTVWDYDGTFGIAVRKDGVAVPDAEAVRALGLTLPAPAAPPPPTPSPRTHP